MISSLRRRIVIGRARRRLTRCERIAADLYARRSDLQSAFPGGIASDEFWAWLNRFGYTEYPALHGLLLPMPPAHLRSVVGDPNELAFLASGASAFRLLLRVARESRGSLTDFPSLLDFGCGVGRTLRYLLKYAPDLNISGTDVDGKAIAWCKRHITFGSFSRNGTVPPLEHASVTFDLVYAISVFTHLSEENHLAWLGELQRVLRPGGLAVLTILGRAGLMRINEDPTLFRIISVSRQELDRAAHDLDHDRFAFIRQPQGHLDRDLYGIALIDQPYVHHRWQPFFEIVSILGGAVDKWQDAVVLRRR